MILPSASTHLNPALSTTASTAIAIAAAAAQRLVTLLNL